MVHMDYKRALLNKLLDKFEHSKSYLDSNQGAIRRVSVKLLSNEFPEYDIEKPEIRGVINGIVQELTAKGFVGFEWHRFEKGNIIEKVWLIRENIDQAYQEIGRMSKSGRVSAILKMVREHQSSVAAAWIQEYLADAEGNIVARKSSLPFLPDDEEDAQAVLKALQAINDKDDAEDLERVFSLKCFGDSKYFERHVRKKVVGIIRKYLLGAGAGVGAGIGVRIGVRAGNDGEPLSDEQVLAQVGIVKAHEQVDFCGGIVGELAGECIDFSVFKHGIAINSGTIKEIKILDLKAVQRVVFIENKANYLDYINKRQDPEKELVIFHGGFYSPIRGLFFKKVYEVGVRSGGMTFCHWGDIDVGGFRIFHRLKANIIPDLIPLLMDRAAFLSKAHYWIRFDEKYGSMLEEMLSKGDFQEFREVITEMLKVRAKLEQEAFL